MHSIYVILYMKRKSENVLFLLQARAKNKTLNIFILEVAEEIYGHYFHVKHTAQRLYMSICYLFVFAFGAPASTASVSASSCVGIWQRLFAMSKTLLTILLTKSPSECRTLKK